MKYEQYQAISLLVKERLHNLEKDRAGLRVEVAHFRERANPDSLLGKACFKSLKRCQNKLQSVEDRLVTWRGYSDAFHKDMAASLARKSVLESRVVAKFFSVVKNVLRRK
jgi:hypothetical protein